VTWSSLDPAISKPPHRFPSEKISTDSVLHDLSAGFSDSIQSQRIPGQNDKFSEASGVLAESGCPTVSAPSLIRHAFGLPWGRAATNGRRRAVAQTPHSPSVKAQGKLSKLSFWVSPVEYTTSRHEREIRRSDSIAAILKPGSTTPNPLPLKDR
jgi:hypothetical protein